MRTAKAKKLQSLLIKELLANGSVELLLPDGITLEIGILQEDEAGDDKKADDYCYVVATRADRQTMLDSYNLGVAYVPESDTIVYEDERIDDAGKCVRTLDVV